MGDHAPKQWPDRAAVGEGTVKPRAEDSLPDGGAFAPTLGAPLEVTDAARELAAAHQIDLETVTGTGADGRITKDDVQAVVDRQG